MSNTSQITSPRLGIMLAGVGILIVGSLLLLTQAHADQTGTDPQISTIAAVPSDTGATITWNTDHASNSQVVYGTTSGGENAMSTLGDTASGATAHTSFLGGLTPNTTYFYEVVSQLVGSSTNTIATSSEQSFMTTNTGTTGITASSTAPIVSTIAATPTDTGATITWTTDQSSNTQVEYGLDTNYGNTSTLADTGGTMSHSVTLSGLTPSTVYHFAVISGNGSTTATSTDMMFTTAVASTTGTTPTGPAITNVVASTTDTTATVTWNSDVGGTTQVLYGLNTSYGSMSTLDNTLVNNHSVVLIGLTPNTTYHFVVESNNASSVMGSSTDMMFTTTNVASSTSTGSTTTDMLQAEINALQARVSALESFIAGLGGNPGTGTSTPPTGGTGTIDQNGATVNAGGSIDLSGRNFGHEETVNIMLNGSQIATAHADGGGNFSTGSIAAPTTAGTYTYTFTGGTSGITGSATVTVH